MGPAVQLVIERYSGCTNSKQLVHESTYLDTQTYTHARSAPQQSLLCWLTGLRQDARGMPLANTGTMLTWHCNSPLARLPGLPVLAIPHNAGAHVFVLDQQHTGIHKGLHLEVPLVMHLLSDSAFPPATVVKGINIILHVSPPPPHRQLHSKRTMVQRYTRLLSQHGVPPCAGRMSKPQKHSSHAPLHLYRPSLCHDA